MENTAKITSRTKCLGWAYSTVFSGGRVEVPQKPMFVGTINQLCKRIKNDPQYQADQNLKMASRWFYRDAMILGIDNGTYASIDQRDIDFIIRLLDGQKTTVYLDRPLKRGRPKTLGETTPVTVRLEPDCMKILESLEGNPSEVIRRLLREQKNEHPQALVQKRV